MPDTGVFQKKSYVASTRFAILLSNVLHEPFAILYPLLSFILLKDLGASAFQIVVLIMLKPICSLLSCYWSASIQQRRDRLRMNLLGAGILARLPLLIAMHLHNSWFIVVSASLYMLFYRAGMPAWMEILKLNLPKKVREKCFSVGAAIGYAEGVILAIGVGILLDRDIALWKWLYSIAILLGILGVAIQCFIPIRGERRITVSTPTEVCWQEQLIRPWSEAWRILKRCPDFARFQWGFMIGGFGLMLMQPSIPLFFDQTLHLSYKELMIAYSICKGLGFVVSSSIWSRTLAQIPVNRFTQRVLWGFFFFPCCILLSQISHLWLYVAYMIYGVAQAGSHLIWHLSGPIFADSEDSSGYTNVNLLMVGLRGLIAPPLGGWICVSMGPAFPVGVSSLLAVLGVAFFSYKLPGQLREVRRL